MLFKGLAGDAGAGKDTVADYLVDAYGLMKMSFAAALYDEVSAAFGISVEELQDRSTKELPHPKLTARRCTDGDFQDVLYDAMGWDTGSGFGEQPNIDMEFSPRRILQLWGTEYRRNRDANYWVEKAAVLVGAFLISVSRPATDEEMGWEVPNIGDPLPEPHADSERTARSDHPGLVFTDVRFKNEADWIKGSAGTIWHVRRTADYALEPAAAQHASAKRLPLRTGDKLIINNGTIPQLFSAVSLALQGNDIVNAKGE